MRGALTTCLLTAMLLAGCTASEMLHVTEVGEGDTILVHGASGAVGVSVLRWVSASAASPFMLCFIERRLKNSLRCALVVATLTMRQFFRMYSWISARIQCSA